MSRTHLSFASVCALVVAVVHAAPQAPSKSDADAVQRKVAAIMIRATLPPRSAKAAAPLRTTFTERELNAFLKLDAGTDIPPGVMNPQISLLGENHLAAKAMVDLDVVRRSKPRGMFDPMNLLTGTVEVTVTGAVHVAAGLATFQLDKATLGGVTVPKALLQELVSFYSKSAEQPQGVDIDKPFPMPASIRSVDIQRGAVVVIQ